MAESILPEAVESEAKESKRATPDLATSFALHEARRSASGTEAAAAFLDAHRELVEHQVRYVDEEYFSARRAGRLKRYSDILRVLAQAAFIAIGVGIAAGVAALWWSALTSHAVVVSAFETPDSLADRGLNGQVVADKVLDSLLQIQYGTRVAAAKFQVEDAWSNTVEVTLPETGISINQISNALHRTFGHDIHISGALTRPTEGGLKLAIRGDGVPPKRFLGGDGDIDMLTQEAAEYVFGYAQPLLFANYLLSVGRPADAVGFTQAAYARASDADRPVLANLWGEALLAMDRIPESAERFRFAMTLNPHYWRATNNLIGVLPAVLPDGSGEEQAYALGQDMQAQSATLSDQQRPTAYDWTNYDQLTMDPAGVIAGLTDDRRLAQSEGAEYDASSWIAEQEATRHDWVQSAIYLAASPTDDQTTLFDVENLGGLKAMDEGDYARAAGMFESANWLWTASPQLRGFFPYFPCNIGHAYVALGDTAKTAPFLADRRFVGCRAYAADAIDRDGNWAAAQAAYKAAEAAAPHMSMGYYREALAWQRHGDNATALDRLAEAQKVSPNWADPFKAQGDILASEQKWPGAIAAYQRALTLSPGWLDLQAALAKAQAANKAG